MTATCKHRTHHLAPRPLTAEEVERIRVHLSKRLESNPLAARDLAIFELGVSCGLRRFEIAALDAAQVWQNGEALEEAELTVTKGGQSAMIYLGPHVRAALKQYLRQRQERGYPLAPGVPLFISERGTRISDDVVWQRMRGLFRSCQIRGKVTVHSLRHTYGTTLDQKGVRLTIIQQLMRHKNLNTTATYLHVRHDELKKASQSL